MLLCFNKEVMKNLLCVIAIIKNENKETIIRIFDYLTTKYDFKPNLISMDFGRGPYMALKENIPIVGYSHAIFT